MYYTVVYEGDPRGAKILSGEPASGRAVTVSLGDAVDQLGKLRTLMRLYGINIDDNPETVEKQLKEYKKSTE